MKLYKITLIVPDFDEVGDNIPDYIEDANYPNDTCIF